MASKSTNSAPGDAHRSSTVAMSAARVIVDLAAWRGVQVRPLTERLGISQARLRCVSERLEWGRYLALVESMGAALGGELALQAAARDFVASVPEVAQVAAWLPSPEALMRFFYEVVQFLVFPMVTFEVSPLGGDAYEVRLELDETPRSRALFSAACAGVASSVSRFLGAGESEVRWALTPRGACYEVQFPPVPVPGVSSFEPVRDLGLHYLESFGRGAPTVLDEARARFNALVEDLPRLELERRMATACALWGLSPRQVDVLRLLVRGLGNKDLAQRLGISHRTVELHLSAMLEKSGTESRTQLLSRFWAGPGGPSRRTQP